MTKIDYNQKNVRSKLVITFYSLSQIKIKNLYLKKIIANKNIYNKIFVENF